MLLYVAAFCYCAMLLQGVKVCGIDLFNTSAQTVADMVAAGLVPICYFRCDS